MNTKELKQNLNHLTGGRLNDEELDDLTAFVERLLRNILKREDTNDE